MNLRIPFFSFYNFWNIFTVSVLAFAVSQNTLGRLLQLPWSFVTAALEQCSNIAVRLLRGCWNKFTGGSVKFTQRLLCWKEHLLALPPLPACHLREGC